MAINRASRTREYLTFSNADEACAFLNAQEGHVPAPGSKVTPLLPAPEDVMSLLGFKGGVPSLVSYLSAHEKQRLPVSRATLFKWPSFMSGQQKPSKSTIYKLMSFFYKHAPNAELLKIPRHQTGGVAEAWGGLISGLKTSNHNLGELSVLVTFFEERMHQEHELLMQLAIELSDEKKFEIYIDTLRTTTLLSEAALGIIYELLHKNKDLTNAQKCLWLSSSKLDFYFSAIACLEVGWLDRIVEESPEMLERRPTLFKQGVVKNFIRKLSFKGENVWLECPFELYLDWLATEIGTSVQETCISKSQLASYIPLDREEDTAGGYTRVEKQKDLLKDWKNSKYPSPEKFRQFVWNLRGSKSGDAQFLIDIGLVVMLLNKLVLELFIELEGYQSVECYQALSESMQRYEEYFKHYRGKFSVSE